MDQSGNAGLISISKLESVADLEETRLAMRQLVLKAKILSKDSFEELLEGHHLFLESGGAGGKWSTFYIDNLIFGVYQGIHTSDTEGKQLKLSFHDLSQLDLKGISLPYADCSAVKAPRMDWQDADLEGSLFIDSYLEGANFAGADLFAADFSRSDLRNCNFQNASLINTDFEKCDLSGADFRGAKYDSSTLFKGAQVKNVRWDN